MDGKALRWVKLQWLMHFSECHWPSFTMGDSSAEGKLGILNTRTWQTEQESLCSVLILGSSPQLWNSEWCVLWSVGKQTVFLAGEIEGWTMHCTRWTFCLCCLEKGRSLRVTQHVPHPVHPSFFRATWYHKWTLPVPVRPQAQQCELISLQLVCGCHGVQKILTSNKVFSFAEPLLNPVGKRLI